MTTDTNKDTTTISDADRIRELEARVKELEERIQRARLGLSWADDLWETFNDLAGEVDHTTQEAQGMLMILQGIIRRAETVLSLDEFTLRSVGQKLRMEDA